METKPGLTMLKLIPAKGGIIVQNEYGVPSPVRDGDTSIHSIQTEPPYVFTDHEELSRFLYNYFVDTEAELKKRAKNA